MRIAPSFARCILLAICLGFLGIGCAIPESGHYIESDPPVASNDASNGSSSSLGSWASSSADQSRRTAESMAVERLFLFMPMPYDPETELPTIPPVEEVDFVSDDETALHGWHAHHDNPRAVILYCHGNAGNLTHRAPLLRILNQYVGASVFVFDYRGYGKSEGRPSEGGLYADARAARAWLAEREGIAESDVVLMGRSLGGAVAIHLASEDGARALIIESTFTSVPDMAKLMMPNLPISGLLLNRFESIDKIGDYEGPLFASHGTADRTIPFEHGRQLFAAANEPKTFIPIERSDHNTPLRPAYYQRLAEFLDGLPTAGEIE